MKEEFYVAGFKHHQGQTVLPRMSVGDHLNMIPEPSNEFDPNAIKLKYEGVMIGYIPARVAKKLISKKAHSCTITNLDPEANPWMTVKVGIKPL